MPLEHAEVLRATERAMGRASALVHEDLKRGLNTLATLTSIAPWVGILGTLAGIACDTFVGFGVEKSTGLGIIAKGLSRSIVSSAMGLLVGIHSLWVFRRLSGELAEFDREMEGMSQQVLNVLTRLRPTHRVEVSPSMPYLEAYCPDPDRDRRVRRRAAAAAIGMLALAWVLLAAARLGNDLLPSVAAMRGALVALLIRFAFSCLPTYAVWVDLLHRRSTGVAPTAAALCVCWCSAELLFPALRF